jgi:hypothetical protein
MISVKLQDVVCAAIDIQAFRNVFNALPLLGERAGVRAD